MDVGELQALDAEKLLEQDRVFVSGARGLGHRAPLRAERRSVVDGEDDVGVAGVDGEQHDLAEIDFAGGDGAHAALLLAQEQRAALVDAFENPHRLLALQARANARSQPRRARKPRVPDG